MDIVKAASDWAKAEVVSAMFFMLFGLVYLLAAAGFWQWASTALTRALAIPMLLAGALLLSAGISFYVSNKSKLANFAGEYNADPASVIASELERTESTIKTYESVALKVFPVIIFVAILIATFVSQPLVRAICIAIIAFLAVLVLLDSQALKRMKKYDQQLRWTQAELNR